MAHVSPAILGPYASRPRRSRSGRSWHLIAGVDVASGIGMLVIGIALPGLAAVIALVLGCLVLVESGFLVAGLSARSDRDGWLNYRPR